jgi:predicted kinase
VQAIIFIGLQGAGKSSFYERFFATTHLRISMDLAGTRAREKRLIGDCIARRRDFVLDNTNATSASRKPCIELAKAAGYEVTGYFFITDFRLCLERNAARIGKARIPVPALYRTRKVLEAPLYAEGFDQLYRVSADRSDFEVAAISPGAPESLIDIRRE